MSIKTKYHVTSIKTEETKEWFLKKHYAHRIPNSLYTFGLYKGSLLQGVLSFGMNANYSLNTIIDGYRLIELNRLVINENLEKNTLSFFVSQSLSLLPLPLVIISYADSEQGHHGYIYQATNWIYTGQSEGKRCYFKNGKEYHRKTVQDVYGIKNLKIAKELGWEYYTGKPKYRYFYFLGTKREKKDMLKKLPYKILPYPKGDNTRYDASYEVKTQLVLL